MKMKLKLDDNGQVALNDEKPIYIMEDGKEFVADVPSLYSKTLELKGESKRHREAKELAETRVSFYADLFPDMDAESLKEWKATADAALGTVKNLEDKKLLDAKKVEIIKNDLREAHDKNLATIKKSFAEKESDYQEHISKKDEQIFKLMVGNAFANSKFFSGKDPLTLLTPDIALAAFGNNFKVKENENTGELQIVGYCNGTEILSTQPDRVGEIASIEESIEVLIDRYPNKDRIMAAGRSGSGAGGGAGFSTGGGDEVSRLQKQYKAAQEAKDARLMITIQNKLNSLQQQQQEGH